GPPAGCDRGTVHSVSVTIPMHVSAVRALSGGRSLGAERPRCDTEGTSQLRPYAPLPAPLSESPSPGRIPKGSSSRLRRGHPGQPDDVLPQITPIGIHFLHRSFQARFHFFSCFSRVIASTMRSCIS